MSALQEIAGNIEQYPKRIREAKEKKRYTISDIVDLSGVSKSAVSKLLDGSQMDPKLYNSVAMCMVLDLSLDELFGLDKPIDHPESMHANYSPIASKQYCAALCGIWRERVDIFVGEVAKSRFVPRQLLTGY